jgi:hypothetical protein
VRIALMRSTIHLVTARDCLAFRPLVEPVIERSMRSNFGRNLAGLDAAALAAEAARLLGERPMTFAELGRRLGETWPDRDQASLCQAVRAWLPLVQVPPRGLWGRAGPIAHTTAQAWLGPLDVPPMTPGELVVRYLAAFGPATVTDAQTWSGLTRLREVFDRLRPTLRALRDAQGRDLFDLPDAPRPDPETPAPPRFLPEYDNILLSHADRARVISDGRPVTLFPGNGATMGNLLVDGYYRATWRITRRDGTATLTVDMFDRLSPRDSAEVTEEGMRLLAFAAGDTDDHVVRLLGS